MRKILLFIALSGFASAGGLLGAAESAGRSTRTEDVVYGRKFGTALTLDVFQPEKPKGAYGARSDTAESRRALSAEISPINFVSAKMAPTLVLHGDADKLVSPYQAKIFEEKCQAAGAPFKLVWREGKDHGWPEMVTDREVFADWFDQHLLGAAKTK